MTYLVTPYVLISAFAAVIAVAVAIVAWPRRDAPGGRPLIGLMLAVAIWSAGAAVEYATVEIPAKIFWAKVQYAGVVTCPVFFLLLALEYEHLDQWLTHRTIGYLFVIPAITFCLAATNEWHGLIWPSVTPSASPTSNLAIYTHGIGFWLGSVGYAYLLMLTGTVLLLRAAFRFANMYWRQAALLVVAVLAPWIVNAIYIAGLSPDPGLELTPLVLVFTGVIFALCIFRFRLLDLAPVAHETVIETMADGMVVLDARNRVVDFNPAAQRLLTPPIPIVIGAPASAILAAWPEGAIQLAQQNESSFELTSQAGEQRFLEVTESFIRDRRDRSTGRLLVIHDITARKTAQIQIEQLNNELEQRVAARTVDYLETIGHLEAEIINRRAVEDQLRRLQGSLVEQLETQGRKMNALYEIMLHYDNQADPDQVLTQALAKITTMMHADAVCMYEVADNTMVLVTGLGLLPDRHDLLRTLPVGWLTADVPLTSFDLSLDQRLPAALVQSGYGALLAATVKFSEFESGALQALWLEPRRVTVEDIVSFSVIAEQVALMLENARLRRSHELEAVRIERRRLARDLHDSVTQSLHSLSLLVSALRNRMQHDQRDKVEATLTNLDLTARQALREMRLLLYEMRLAPEESIRMVETIQTRLEAVENRAGIDATVDVLTPEDWPAAWDAELLPIVMEALNNSLKHASASRVRVQVAGGTDWIELTIQDNGRGFSPGALSHAGMGLQSMCERAERLGGAFEIDAGPGVGARITVRLGTVFHDPDLPAHDRNDTPIAERQMAVLLS